MKNKFVILFGILSIVSYSMSAVTLVDIYDAFLPQFNDADRAVTLPYDRAINKPFDMNIDWQVVGVKADFEKILQLGTHRTGTSPCYCIGWYKKSIYETQDNNVRLMLKESNLEKVKSA
jgi:hypothetical protein